jgi:sugar phosphate permease
MTNAAQLQCISVPVTAGKQTRHRWIILALIFLIYMLASANRACMGFAMPFISKEFGLSNTEAGSVLGVFFLGFGLAQIPAGLLVTTFGVRRVFFPVFSLFAGVVLSAAFAPGAGLLKLSRALMGVLQAPVATGLMTTINNWFPPREKGTATGIYLASSMTGPMLVPFFCAAIIQRWGWREIFTVTSFPWLILLALWMLLARNHPPESRYCSQAEADHIADRITGTPGCAKGRTRHPAWLDTLIRTQNAPPVTTKTGLFRSWGIMGVTLAFFFVMSMVSIVMNWLPSYLATVKQFDMATVALASSMPFAGQVVGNLVGGWISDTLFDGRRKPLMLVTAVGSAIMMYSLTVASTNVTMLCAHLFLVGFILSLGYSNYVVYPAAIASKTVFPLATALVNTGGQLGGASAPVVTGFILDHSNWDTVFLYMAVCSLIALVLVSTMPEVRND